MEQSSYHSWSHAAGRQGSPPQICLPQALSLDPGALPARLAPLSIFLLILQISSLPPAIPSAASAVLSAWLRRTGLCTVCKAAAAAWNCPSIPAPLDDGAQPHTVPSPLGELLASSDLCWFAGRACNAHCMQGKSRVQSFEMPAVALDVALGACPVLTPSTSSTAGGVEGDKLSLVHLCFQELGWILPCRSSLS